jgi:hypothetical protein
LKLNVDQKIKQVEMSKTPQPSRKLGGLLQTKNSEQYYSNLLANVMKPRGQVAEQD